MRDISIKYICQYLYKYCDVKIYDNSKYFKMIEDCGQDNKTILEIVKQNKDKIKSKSSFYKKINYIFYLLKNCNIEKDIGNKDLSPCINSRSANYKKKTNEKRDFEYNDDISL